MTEYELQQISKRTVELPESIELLGHVCKGTPVLEQQMICKDTIYEETWVHYVCLEDGEKWGIYMSLDEGIYHEKNIYLLLMCGEDALDSTSVPIGDQEEMARAVRQLCESAMEYRNMGREENREDANA